MRSFLSALMREGVISIVVLVLLCLLVWFGGEFLASEEDPLIKERIAIIAVLLGLWVLLFIVQKVLAIRSATRIEKQLKAQSGSELDGADADKKAEIEALRSKFDESLQALKKTKGGKSALFTLPWYVIIGPPGSGKTTALQESGLNFPAAQGGAKVRGIGGTRNCDWWFTEDGILLDTAGRYTTVAEDQEEWFAFLEMIKNSRASKPINGAIVAIAVDDLFRGTQSELDQMAQDVRNRLDELAARLQAVFPVYMMFTKCDLVSGFMEFFEDFSKEERAQVWGFTFPYALPDRQYTDIFDEEVNRMKANVKARQLKLLGSERPPQKKQNIYLFPRQLDLAQQKMKEFLGSLFGANAFQESAMLRGIYFTSGTQKGTPIDQILSRMGEAMGMGGELSDGEERIEKKSFFIHNLFTKIIFRDKTLARSSSRVLRRRRAVRLSIQLASLLTLVLMGWVLIGSFVGNHEIVADVEDTGKAVNELSDSGDLDIEKLETMEALRAKLANLRTYREEGRPLRLSFGMYQGNTMFEAGAAAYFRRLNPTFIKPCHERVQDELNRTERELPRTASQDEYQNLLELWRVYRMLSGDLRVDADLVQTVLARENRWTGPLPETDKDRIHNLALEQLQFYAVTLRQATRDSDPYGLLNRSDVTLVRRVGERLKNAFWEDAAYEAIIQRTSEKLNPLTLDDIVTENRDYLEFREQDAVSTYIKRLNAFTQSAWDNQVKQLIDERAKSIAKLYQELELEGSDGSIRSEDQVRVALMQTHRERHREVWNSFLRAVHPNTAVFSSVRDARESMKTLTGDDSPYRELIRNVWDYRKLTLAPDVRIAGPAKEEIEALNKSFEALGVYYNAYDTFTKNTREGERATRHLDDKDNLTDLAAATSTAATEVTAPFPKRDETAALSIGRIVDAGFRAVKDEAQDEIRKKWQDEVYGLWTDKFEGQFPFDTGAEQYVTMDYFSRMFNPANGSLWAADELFRELARLRFDGKPLIEFTAAYEDTIQAARNIKDAMFHSNSDERVNVKFTLKMQQVGLMKSSEIQIGTDADGNAQTIRWNEFRDQSKDFTWAQHPSRLTKLGMKITAEYSDASIRLPPKNLIEDDWGVLKMFWSRALSFRDLKTDPPTYKALWEFRAPDGQLFYLHGEVTPQKRTNPFDKSIFTDFSMSEKVHK